MRIRRAVQKDRELIWRATMETVWQDLSQAEQREVGRTAMEEHFRPHAREVIERPESEVLVAEAPDGTVVGYTILGRATSMVSPHPFGFVYDLWVAPEARRQGVARRLMEHAAGWCRRQGLSTLRLEVAAGNLGARAFYAAEGFAEERLYLGRGV
ncbi:MAG TPA: GNAT family N-acetyltransferase [Thermoplasmata archaeon]|nr:GNAT family N-acetyltransferase [Thermoplasmata archaeon]